MFYSQLIAGYSRAEIISACTCSGWVLSTGALEGATVIKIDVPAEQEVPPSHPSVDSCPRTESEFWSHFSISKNIRIPRLSASLNSYPTGLHYISFTSFHKVVMFFSHLQTARLLLWTYFLSHALWFSSSPTSPLFLTHKSLPEIFQQASKSSFVDQLIGEAYSRISTAEEKGGTLGSHSVQGFWWTGNHFSLQNLTLLTFKQVGGHLA